MKYCERNKDEHRNVGILACDGAKGSDLYLSGDGIQMKQQLRME
jgi:hypothetical protein